MGTSTDTREGRERDLKMAKQAPDQAGMGARSTNCLDRVGAAESSYRIPLLEECPQHHGHKGNPELTPGTCGAIGERTQVILVWMRALRLWESLPPTMIRSHKG